MMFKKEGKKSSVAYVEIADYYCKKVFSLLTCTVFFI